MEIVASSASLRGSSGELARDFGMLLMPALHNQSSIARKYDSRHVVSYRILHSRTSLAGSTLVHILVHSR